MQLNSTALANAPTTTGASDHVSHPMPANRKNAISVSTHRSAVAPVRLVVVSSNCASCRNHDVVGAHDVVQLVEVRLLFAHGSPYRSSSFANASSIRVIASARETPRLPYHANQFLDHHVYRRIGQAERFPIDFRDGRAFSTSPTRSARRSPDLITPYGWCCSLPPAEWPARAP